ncbi:coiled-coil domain-containing protein [Psychrosphaera aestuarii]|uniref:hypothetical protein n=1 Tax=Psychrosphaera aestuarii TaxID=1266052 RepID=UPI001B32F925|nr:hypothetical protein [Psychrosphaera aestuarii]
MAKNNNKQNNPILFIILFIVAFLILLIGTVGVVLYISVFLFYLFKWIKIPPIAPDTLQLTEQEEAEINATQNSVKEEEKVVQAEIERLKNTIIEPEKVANTFKQKINFVNQFKNINNSSSINLENKDLVIEQLKFAPEDSAYLSSIFNSLNLITQTQANIDATIENYRANNGSFNKNGSISLKSNKGKETKKNIDNLKLDLNDQINTLNEKTAEFLSVLELRREPYLKQITSIEQLISEQHSLLRALSQKEQKLIQHIHAALNSRKEKALDTIAGFLDEYRIKATALVSMFAFSGSIVICLDNFKQEMVELSNFVTTTLSLELTFLPDALFGVLFCTSIVTWFFFYLFFTMASDKSALMKLQKQSPELYSFLEREVDYANR